MKAKLSLSETERTEAHKFVRQGKAGLTSCCMIECSSADDRP
jgi:hypothetical protein